MSTPVLENQIAAAKAYEALFVPALFGEWAPRVADEASLSVGDRVLDVACGTGVLARAAHQRTAPTGAVTGLDPSPGMLAVANRLCPPVDWRLGAAEALPFAEASFHAVVSQFGLMFMECEAAIREMLRVLRPGGRLVVAVWDTAEHNTAYAAEIALLDRVLGARAADALRAPFALGDRDRLEQMFTASGAGPVTINTRKGEARFPSIRVMVEADLRGWLPVMGVRLGDEEIGRTLDEAENALAAFAGGDGRVAFDTSAHLVTATKH